MRLEAERMCDEGAGPTRVVDVDGMMLPPAILGSATNSPVVRAFSEANALVRDGSYLENPSAGLAVALSEDGYVRAVFLHAEGKDDFGQYQGPLPAGLTFSSNRGDIRREFGTPDKIVAPGAYPGGDPHGGLERYDLDACYIHFSYWPDGTIQLVTIGLPDR